MIGRTISHYKILEELGRGGMGVVYKAEDTELKRTVALKFLPSAISAKVEERERFKIEAQAAAALNHPNIATIYAIEEVDEEMFIVMEYIEGQELKQRIDAGPMNVDEALNIAMQIADGLQAAHKKGVFHRDIKSSNIMLTENNRVKIMDFGLAKLGRQTKLTKKGTTLGTVAYMSPEQTRGEDVDHRTDIWSLGVVLYEMLTGQLPFKGEYDQALIYSILNEAPELPSSVRKEIPNHLEQIVIKALEKDSKIRYQSMKDALEELKKQVSLVTAKEKKQKSIVVLPFDDMSPNKDNEYFSDGLTEEIITDLSQIHTLRVISRNSAMMLKGTQKATKTIGRELNVQYILEGSVRKAGNNLRITAKLIDANTDTHLWAEKYSGTLEDVFDIQEKVSRLIADTLKIKLTFNESTKISERPIDNVKAYECWLKARQAIFDWTEESLEQASHFLETGLEILGDNPVLFAGLGFLHMFYFNSGIQKDPGVLLKAEDYFNKAFQLDLDVSLANYGMGFIRYLQGNIKESIRYLTKAIDMDPNNTDSMRLLSYIYGGMLGNAGKVAQLAKKIIEVDPLWPVNYLGPVFVHWAKGELKKALEYCKKYYQMAPKNIHARFWYAEMLAWNNRWDEASELIEKNQKEFPEHTITKFHLFFKYSFENKTKDAIQTLSDELLDYAWHNEWYAWKITESYALINKKSESLKWLERMIDMGHCNYPLLSKLDPFLENIRGEERFKKLMKRVKKEWENFKV